MDDEDIIVIDSDSDDEQIKSHVDARVKMEVDEVDFRQNENNIFNGDEIVAEEKKKLGNEQYKAQNYDSALKLYSDAISLCPDSAQYYNNRAACYMMQGKYKLALADARQSVRLDPAFDKAYVRITKCCLTLGDIGGADRAIKKCLEVSPHNQSILYEKNVLKQLLDFEAKYRTEIEKKDYRSAVYYADNMLKIAPYCIKYRLIKGECLAYLGRCAEAQDLAVDAMKLDATSAEAVYVRGLCLYFTDNMDKAADHFAKALTLDPDHAKSKDMRYKSKKLKAMKEEGNRYYNLKRYDEALSVYTEALKIDEYNADVNSKLYYNRALVSSKKGEMEQTIADCTRVLQIKNDYLKALLLRARSYYQLGKYAECVEDYETAVSTQNDPEYRRLLRDAKNALKKAIRVDHYAILGVPKNATMEQIKAGYKRKAMLHHPDRHTNSTEDQRKNEEIKFKEISKAYNVLTDPQKRRLYDNEKSLENDFSDQQMRQSYYFFSGPNAEQFEYNLG